MSAFSQNEAKKWFFGNGAGLDFSTTPPTPLTSSTMIANYSAASIADNAGNLLFYTNGNVIWDKTHVPMANGSGLLGGANGTGGSQQVIIIKKPASNSIYYVFYTQPQNFTIGTLYCSEVDMSLASGNGSVTVKNSTVFTTNTNTISLGKITATRHCNGTDIWLVTRDWYWWNAIPLNQTVTVNNSFRSFLITSSGINPVPVVSTPATYTMTNWAGSTWDYGCMKLSPNGKKLGVSIYGNNNNFNGNQNAFELYDYNNTTGVVSNSLGLMPNLLLNTWTYAWGCEFSADGSKFYGAKYNNTNGYLPGVYQWDLCAGSPTAIAASMYTVYTSNVNSFAALQLASDGKIYVSRWNVSPALDVINNPNAQGSACGYTVSGQSIAPKAALGSLPNFMTSYLAQNPPTVPFTHTVSNQYGCQSALFNTAYSPTVPIVGCSSSYVLTAFKWDFGDPGSGAANTSTLNSPVHSYPTLGTYTVKLILYYSCGMAPDTIKKVVNINQPCISVSSTSITCAHLGSATVQATGGIGPFSYTWMPSAQASPVATGLSPGTYTLTVFDFGNNYTYTATTHFTSLIPLTGNLNYAGSVTCNGASTATANVTNMAGGSGTVSYLWWNPSGTTYTAPTPSLSAGIWSVQVTDVLTGCQINQSFLITQPTALSLTLSANTPTACAGKSINLNGGNSGGTPYLTGSAYTYTWSGGPATSTRTVSQALAGTYVYTLNSRDSLNCHTSNTIAVDFIPNPTLSVSHVSICPLETGTLNVSGASTYTWSDNTNNSFLTHNPAATQQYTVTGEALSCTAVATASIILKPTPFPIFNHNSPICNGQNLNIQSVGGVSYAWTGPLGYASTAASFVITAASPANSGAYNLTITAANNCTASTTKTLTIYPTPTISVQGDTVCTNQGLHLQSSSFVGASYLWKGPSGYSSSVQNPFINNPSVNYTGTYTLKVTSVEGCTNTAATDVSVTALPIPTITSNGPLCYGKSLNLNGSGGAQYSWSGPNNFSSSSQNPSISAVSLAANGIYSLQIILGPCVNNTTHSLTVFPLPSFTVTSSTNVCETKTLYLYGGMVGNAVSYFWQGPSGFLSAQQNTSRSASALDHSGIYTLTVVDANTCINSETIAVTILQNPVLVPQSATVCLNEPATLSVTGADTYLWLGPDFYQSNHAAAFVASASNPALSIYTVMGTAVNSCTSITTASLNTLPLPKPAIAVTPGKRLCFNSNFVLEGSGGLYYEWFSPDRTRYATQSKSLTANSPVYAGIYTLVVTDEKSCRNSTTQEVIIDPLPGGSLKASVMEGCVPFKSEFSYYASNAEAAEIVTDWQVGNEAMTRTKHFYRDFTIAGDHLITGIFTNTITGCVNTGTYMVHAYSVPVADFTFSPQKPVEGIDEVLFTNTSRGLGMDKFNWYLISNEGPVSTNENTTYRFEKTGVYPVAMVVGNTWGCADTVVKSILVDPDFSIYVPNVFTPDGDGLNDVFQPVCIGVKFYEMSILDRWGKILFRSDDPNLGWDGSYNGELSKSDVYVWKINISSTTGEMKEMKGYVTLLR